jgi:glycosyltransferase involved in cell wall biosynthesis
MIDKSETSSRPQSRDRVCMIAYTSYLTDGRVRLEAESLVQWGYEVYFLVLKTGSKPRSFVTCGVNIIELNVRKYRGRSKIRYLISYLQFLLLAFVTCTRMFLGSRVGVIHVHNMPDVLVFAALVPRLFGCKVVLDIHDSVPETYAGKFERTLGVLFKVLSLEERLCCLFAHKVICVNHVQRETLIARGIPAEKLCTVITMPVFTMHPQLQSMRDGDRSFRVVNHGTVSRRLGIDLLIRAAAKLAHEIPDFQLHIIGGGEDWEYVAQLAESLGISDYTHLRRDVPWDTLPQELSVMDVGVVANRANIATQLMLPLKLIDYVTLGIPAVVPRLRAIEYYFTPDMVSYFEPESVDSMVRAVLALYQSRELRKRQSTNARRFVEQYNWRKKRDLRDLYATLCAEACVDPIAKRTSTDEAREGNQF